MTKERLTPERRRERTRIALLEAGAEAFARRGYHGASLDEIAEAAGFSKGAIYDHFGSKDDFFFAVLERRNEERMASFASLSEGDAVSLSTVLSGAVDLLTDVFGRDRDAALLEAEAWLYAQRDERVRQRLAVMRRRALDQATALVEQSATATGARLRMPSRDAAALLTALTTGLSQMALADPEAGHDALYDRLIELVVEV